MIDFSTINAFSKGQRESFEDLICVLARREKHVNGVEFQPNNGSGGDGGVEAIWLLSNGRKIGYQAKYFTSIGTSQWAQMDKSVKQALKVHPELQTYLFALSIDLTPPKGMAKKSQREKWDDHVIKWTRWASEQSIEIEFKLWTETDLREILLRENNTNLIKYWFGRNVLNDYWFTNQVNHGIKALGERFNAREHVSVTIETLFDFIARTDKARDELINGFREFKKTKLPIIEPSLQILSPAPELQDKILQAWNEVVKCKKKITKDFNQKWDIPSILKNLDSFNKCFFIFKNHFDSFDSEADKSLLKNTFNSLNKLSSSFNSLSKLLCGVKVKAETHQCALIHGPAGVGKSHVLGLVAEKRIQAGLPTVLLLGQSFSNSPFWEQLGSLLGLEDRTPDDLLSMLNSAGERVGERCLILIDAINEGVGSSYWRNHLNEFISHIKKYPFLAIVFSCREEYLPYTIPNSLTVELPKLPVNGFNSFEEKEVAAINYLDKKGIARPNTPWLSPEFYNPLFLKTTSEALKAKDLNEFPRGLSGISSIMALYLDALSLRTGYESLHSEDISRPIKQCVLGFSKHMAKNACDYVELPEATNIAATSFIGRVAPAGKTWLEVLINTSLFRKDPPPFSQNIDPFKPPSELIRFSFQKFQDHLMAKALVEEITVENQSLAFGENGPLNFLFHGNNLDDGIKYQYAGLISSLSTIYPEQLSLEFAHTLPNWEKHWHYEELLQKGFGESFKSRCSDAFTDSTKDLLNQLNENYIQYFEIILEVSLMIEHPFNALSLHEKLKQYRMPERDSYWTRWINWASKEDGSQINRLVSWALSGSKDTNAVQHIELASLVLAWALTSSHITLRDKATKALTNLFLSHQDSFIYLLNKMHDCNDPYVVERLYSAAFGACCIDQSFERLSTYSQEVYVKFFANASPSKALLTRDYALGIIEVAKANNAFCNSLSIENCFPPFKSELPTFNLKIEEVERLAEVCGGKEIFHSASSEWGDFGKYSIPGKVDVFLTSQLNSPAPISFEERKKTFIENIIKPFGERVTALNEFEEVNLLIDLLPFSLYHEDNEEEQQLEIKKTEKLKHLETLLNEFEISKLHNEYLNEQRNDEFEKLDVQQCRLWITKRAYELGWNSKLFNNDGYGTSHNRHENDLERIGKKYQRIALDELQARLADNYWELQDWPEKPSIYKYSHQNFRRDYEPTILPLKEQVKTKSTNSWMTAPNIELPNVTEENLKSWPFEEDPTLFFEKNLLKIDESENSWFTLYEYNSDKQRYKEPNVGEHGLRFEEFRFLYCVFIEKNEKMNFINSLKSQKKIDGHSFRPAEFTDGPYLLEAFWRSTWESGKFSENLFHNDKSIEFAIPATRYLWESHLDKSLPEGFTIHMPQKWLAEELNLSISKSDISKWVDKDNNVVFQSMVNTDDRTAVLINQDILSSYSNKFNIEPVWLMISERSAFPNGSNSHFCGRRSEGIAWLEEDSWKTFKWNRDTKR